MAALLDYPSLVAALEEMFRAGCTAPVRHHHAVPGGTLLLMPAWQEGGPIGVKLVTVFPGNAARALPSVFGTYLLLDGETGAPLASLDGPALTIRRTAAASRLAARHLARPDSRVMLMVGTGALAPELMQAHARGLALERIMIWGRDPAKAASLARRLSIPGIAIEAVPDLAAAAGQADLISCATLAREPLLRGEWLRPGTHLDLVGGFTPAMREADDGVIRRCRIYVDTMEGATQEAGDIVQPLRNGTLRLQEIHGDLFGLTRGTALGRGSLDEITLFKSVGTALEDLAAARLALARFADASSA